MRTLVRVAALAAAFLISGTGLAAGAPSADSVDGRWDAELLSHGTVIPFRLDISGSGPTLKGTFYDGFEPYDGTTSATFEDGKLVLTIEHYLITITATLHGDKLTGLVVTANRGSSAQYGFAATRHRDTPAAAANAPSIAGTWVIPLDTPSSKGEKAFRFIVRQRGPEVAAAILRIDGDTGSYSGTYANGKWVLSHFDGSRPGVIVVTPKADGTLEIIQHVERPAVEGAQAGANAASYQTASSNAAGAPYGEESAPNGRYADKLTAYRPAVALAKGLPQPDNFLTHTTARDPNERFTFRFPDVDGHLISSDDPRFKGKVVLAIVTGTWCPNCHDEAQYLVKLDKKYRKKGLAIVALDFEEPEQQGSFARERAFVKQYGVKYTYLIAGAPEEMWEKVPQLVNLNTWPTTVFVGRDGRIRAVHSGFASPASGVFYTQLQKEFTSRIEKLLAEQPPATLASAAPTSGGSHTE